MQLGMQFKDKVTKLWGIGNVLDPAVCLLVSLYLLSTDNLVTMAVPFKVKAELRTRSQ